MESSVDIPAILEHLGPHYDGRNDSLQVRKDWMDLPKPKRGPGNAPSASRDDDGAHRAIDVAAPLPQPRGSHGQTAIGKH